MLRVMRKLHPQALAEVRKWPSVPGCVVAVAAFACVHLALLSLDVGSPWPGDYHGGNGALFSLAGRNFVRWGFLRERLTPDIAPGASDPHAPSWYANHPPLLPVLVGGAFRVFGAREGVARAIPILASLVSLFALYGLSSRLWGSARATWIAGIFALLPMTAYFGNMVGHEPLTLAFVLLFRQAYIAWLSSPSSRRLWGAAAALACAQLSGWPGFEAAAITLVLLVGGRSTGVCARWRHLAGVILTVTILTGLLLLAQMTAGGGAMRVFGAALGKQASGEAWQGRCLAIGTLFAVRFWVFFSPLVLVLTALQVVSSRRDRRPVGTAAANESVFWLVLGVLHVLVFLDGARLHEYWMFYLSPWFAIQSGIAIARAKEAWETKGRRFGAAVGGMALLVLWLWTFPLLLGPLGRRAASARSDRHTVAAWRQQTHGVPVALYSCWIPPQIEYYWDRRLPGCDSPELLRDEVETRGTEWVLVRIPRMDEFRSALRKLGRGESEQGSAYGFVLTRVK